MSVGLVHGRARHLLAEAAARQRYGIPFGGLIYAPQVALPLGRLIEDLELLAKAATPADFLNAVQYLPLR